MDQATNLRTMLKAESGKIHQLRRSGKNRSLSASATPRVIAVTSGKGGVGKTNIVGNLAIACQRMGKRILIFDADLGLANIDIIFGINPKYTIAEVIRGEKELSQIIIAGPEGVSLIPASSGIQELAQLEEGHKINLLNEFDRLNDRYDIVLIDTGAGISSNVIYFNIAAQERIVVLTPEPTSITDAYALMKVMYNQHKTDNFYLLVNMAPNEQKAKSVYRHLCNVVARFMGNISIDYAGFIPVDNRLPEAVRRREPVNCCYPDAPSSQSFNTLARYLLSRKPERSNDGNIKFFWQKLMAGVTDEDNARRR